jgi:hypothetical protein
MSPCIDSWCILLSVEWESPSSTPKSSTCWGDRSRMTLRTRPWYLSSPVEKKSLHLLTETSSWKEYTMTCIQNRVLNNTLKGVQYPLIIQVLVAGCTHSKPLKMFRHTS